MKGNTTSLGIRITHGVRVQLLGNESTAAFAGSFRVTLDNNTAARLR